MVGTPVQLCLADCSLSQYSDIISLPCSRVHWSLCLMSVFHSYQAILTMLTIVSYLLLWAGASDSLAYNMILTASFMVHSTDNLTLLWSLKLEAPMSLTQSLRLTCLALDTSARCSHSEVLQDQHPIKSALTVAGASWCRPIGAFVMAQTCHRSAVEFVEVRVQYPCRWAPLFGNQPLTNAMALFGMWSASLVASCLLFTCFHRHMVSQCHVDNPLMLTKITWSSKVQLNPSYPIPPLLMGFLWGYEGLCMLWFMQ